MEQIKQGDIVTLMSGGPEMTVNEVLAKDAGFKCVWTTLDGQFQSYLFATTSVKKVKNQNNEQLLQEEKE